MNGDVPWGRAATVWAAATVLAAALIAWLGTVANEPQAPGFGGWLVTGSGLVGALCVTWLWVLTTVVVVDAIRGRTAPRTGVPGAARRIVLAACGAALASGLASGLITPAHADRGPAVGPAPRPAATAALLVGLPLPDRTTTATRWLGLLGRQAATRDPARRQAESHVVAPGDSLWEIARRTLPTRVSDAEVEQRWQEIYRANRDVVGADPDLIRPGQRLVMPDPRADEL
jgi:nucleoid-associated protein YgaU